MAKLVNIIRKDRLMIKKESKSFFSKSLFGKAAYGPYVLACTCICYIIVLYCNMSILKGFLYEPTSMFVTTKGMVDMSNLESVCIAKLLSYVFGCLFILPISFLIYSTMFIYLLSFIPCFIGKVYFHGKEDILEFLFSEKYKISVPFPFIADVFPFVCNFLSTFLLFLSSVGFHSCFLFYILALWEMPMDEMSTTDYLGLVFFVLISLGVYICGLKKYWSIIVLFVGAVFGVHITGSSTNVEDIFDSNINNIANMYSVNICTKLLSHPLHVEGFE